jgi:hydrogenase nickel incorporation protein HypA/HybF
MMAGTLQMPAIFTLFFELWVIAHFSGYPLKCAMRQNYFSLMHELSVAQSILDTIEKQLGSTKPLTRISLTIGPLAGISAESLEFWLSEIAKQKGFGTPGVVINKTKACAICSSCKAKYEINSFYSACPSCDSFERTLESGFECVIDSIEMEDFDNV